MKKILAFLLVVAMLCSFAACAGDPAPSSSNEPSTNAPSTNPGTTAPVEPTGPVDPVETVFPAADTAYYYGMVQANKDNAVYYLAGGMAQTYYLDTTTDAAASLKIYLETTEGGYYLYCLEGTAKTYINMTVNGTHVNANYEATASTVYTYDNENEILVAQANGEPYTLGTRNDGTYTTVGPVAVSQKGFWCKLYTDDTLPAGPEKPDMPEYGTTLTIEQLLALPVADGETTSGRFYVRVTVQSVTDARYGAMIVTDSTGSISVYNSASADGTIGYADMKDQPLKGDEVLLYVNVKNFKESFEINSAWIQEVKHNTIDETAYTQMIIDEARKQEVGTLVKVEGVVAKITYATGMKPNGVILVDGTNSIYVYDMDLAGRVSIGNKITVAASKTMWILEKEQQNAEKFGYKGCNQLESAWLLSNDNGEHDFDKSWITETTVKNIMDNPVTDDITSTIYKVTALIQRQDGAGFINYYIDDLDGTTGSYVYTQCNGSDLDWLEPYNGKICTVYLVPLNCKSGTAGCVYRFLPVAVEDNNFDVSSVNVPEFVVKYHGVGQFMSQYTGNPDLELLPSVSSELLKFENAVLSYTSSDSSVISIENGVMKCLKSGTATVTVTASYNGKEYSEKVTITVEMDSKVDAITVEDAIAAEVGTEITVEGIVGPSLVNKDGFYLMGENGLIAVIVKDKTTLGTIELGQKVVITGERDRFIKEGKTCFGQSCITSADVVLNSYGNTEYNTGYFAEKTVAEMVELDNTVDFTTTAYIVKGVVSFGKNAVSITDGDSYITLYASGTAQYEWLKQFDGQEVTLEMAACNWNSKTPYKACVLAVRTEEGKIYNTLNFDNN